MQAALIVLIIAKDLWHVNFSQQLRFMPGKLSLQTILKLVTLLLSGGYNRHFHASHSFHAARYSLPHDAKKIKEQFHNVKKVFD